MMKAKEEKDRSGRSYEDRQRSSSLVKQPAADKVKAGEKKLPIQQLVEAASRKRLSRKLPARKRPSNQVVAELKARRGSYTSDDSHCGRSR